jgi:flagellar basal-body rod modification protein FlgD
MVSALTSSAFLNSTPTSNQPIADAAGEEILGRDAFLQLLTTQLNNQDPLNPMENEAFVAQLAQFSSVEGIKGMQGSLESMASGMRQDQMLAGANLVGKGVIVEGGGFVGGNGATAKGSVQLDYGAQDLVFTIHDHATGELIYTEHMGSKSAGDHSLSWNGLNDLGQPVPSGRYIMSANAVIDGQSQKAPVSTLTEVKSVKWDPRMQELTLEVDDGSYVSLLQVQRISSYDELTTN